jgi:thymidylate synthase
MAEERLELDFATIEVLQPWTLPLVPTVPLGIPPPTDDKMITELFAATRYNYQLRPGVDYYGYHLERQIDYAISQYKKYGFDIDQMCLIASPPDNLFLEDPWCLKLIDTKVQDGKLCFIAYVRGLDIWQGFAYFAAMLELLKQDMAEKIKAQNGQLFIIGKSFCLLEHQVDLAKTAAGNPLQNHYISHFE